MNPTGEQYDHGLKKSPKLVFLLKFLQLGFWADKAHSEAKDCF